MNLVRHLLKTTISFNLLFKHHIKIKILKKAGLAYADFEIPLQKFEKRSEILRSVTASTFNVENGSIREVKLDPRNQFTENRSKYLDIKKFALPNVRVGSVIDVEFVIESPFVRNFRSWEFQSDIPKVYSEYWAMTPGNYRYNITLRGFLKLTKNENTIVKGCLTPGGGASADCAQMKVAMRNIPAFVEEDYMTARSNFLAAVHFELSEIVYFDGRTDKLTQEWKDAENELRRDAKFGLQLRRGGDIMDKNVNALLAGVTDPLAKAQKIYDFIKGWYRWNEVYGEYSEFGIKKAFDSKVGNVGDINLSLIAALRYAGLAVEPVLLSTRQNGSVTELHPVLSDFNYVIAKLNVTGKVYLLDATEDFLSFGLIPERCLNGKGRVLGEKESYWHELKAPDREKKVSMQKFKIDPQGVIHGTIENTYYGYKAMEQRKQLAAYNSQKEFIDKLSSTWHGTTIKNYVFENVDDLTKPMKLTLEIVMEAYAGEGTGNFLLNPFFIRSLGKKSFQIIAAFLSCGFWGPIRRDCYCKPGVSSELRDSRLASKSRLESPGCRWTLPLYYSKREQYV